MTISFKLKYGDSAGWSYIDLMDSTHGNVNYVPEAPAEGQEELVETGTWRVSATTLANLIAAVRAIEDVFRRAADYDLEEIGANQVYLTAQLDGSLEVWESPIYEGRVDIPKTLFMSDWANLELEVVITWRRAGWWQYYLVIPVSNSNGNTVSNGLQIYNRGDGSGTAPTKAENWAIVAAGAVPGDLPAPAVIRLETDYGHMMDQVTIVQSARTILTASLVEGETGTSDTVDANRSGGKYHNYTLPADVYDTVTEISGLRNGCWLRIFLSAKFTGTVKATPFLSLNGVEYNGGGSVLTCTNAWTLYDLGMIWKPPASVMTGFELGYSNAVLGVALTGSVTVSVDYIQYAPVDSFALAKLDGAMQYVLIDCYANQVVGNIAADNLILSVGTLYNGIWLEPGMEQKLVFKFLHTQDGDLMASAATVILSCYARKKTI